MESFIETAKNVLTSKTRSRKKSSFRRGITALVWTLSLTLLLADSTVHA